MRATDRTRFQKDAEARFPIKIDVPVPCSGEPWPFAEMLAWCGGCIASDAWAEHGFRDKKRRDELGIPIDYTRWYFAYEADAVAFDRQWLDGSAAAEIELQRDLVPVSRAYWRALGAGNHDVAARLAADGVFRSLRPGTPDSEAARRTVDRLIETAIERGLR